MKNFDLNAGGFIGAFVGGGIALALGFSGDNSEVVWTNPGKLAVFGLIAGAFAGNILWDAFVKKPARGRGATQARKPGRTPAAGDQQAAPVKSSKNSFWTTVAVVGVLVAALIGEIFTVSLFFKARAIAKWPTALGTITRTDLNNEPGGSAHVQIDYTYRVTDRPYQSSQVRTRGTPVKHQSDVDQLMEKYPVGREVAVYYDPNNPADAYLEAGPDFVNYLIVVTPLAFAGAAGAQLFSQFRPKKGA